MPEESQSSLALPRHADVLQALRAATAPLHERLDTGLPIARKDASLDDYAAHLLVLRPWLLAVRQELAVAGSVALHAAARHIDAKLADLSSDLADAGQFVPMPVPAHAAAFRPAQPAGGPAHAWGLAYVAEGSQLGGVVLHRRLRDRLAPHPLRYLVGADHEAGVAARWRDFILRLRESVADPASIRQAQRGATAAFEDLLVRFRV
ncbi:biliverdin-producing heme oxygenase [Variovorax sp. RA8]|uniref:biliverdin-producing heme oxygenase n=1 Tax=Variovorax sp. (strain JCM 16519 / RA8) TaxID=662548 RepID=UPI001316AB97|nr:biliverdin-producing heme oxygenase [Variovorax sp. RA8]VTU24523.1 Heme oxygenase [Variovorax sp. RA8]